VILLGYTTIYINIKKVKNQQLLISNENKDKIKKIYINIYLQKTFNIILIKNSKKRRLVGRSVGRSVEDITDITIELSFVFFIYFKIVKGKGGEGLFHRFVHRDLI
jgi:hypothetical protein